MHLRRAPPPPRLISLVSMIDVLLIMLVFFMVTSTYLNLDMVPMAASADAPEQASAPPPDATLDAPLLIRLGADGRPFVRGQPVDHAALAALVRAQPPRAAVTILPSLRADTQALVTLMDVLTRAGVKTLRILQVAAP